MTKTNKKKRTGREKKKLIRAVDTLASMIDSIAITMKGEIEEGGDFDIKQLKELTGAAKELSGLISSLNCDSAEEDKGTVTVLFSGEGEEWAK